MKAIFIVLLILLVFAGCNSDVKTISGVDGESTQNNIIFASSFEANGEASWDGWINPGPPVVKFASDAPASGGKFSIFLKAEEAGAVVYRKIAAEQGSHNYELSFWGKATEDPGKLEFIILRGNEKIALKRVIVGDNAWTEYKIKADFTAVQGDSLMIYLGGSAYTVPQGFTYFDSIVVRLLN